MLLHDAQQHCRAQLPPLFTFQFSVSILGGEKEMSMYNTTQAAAGAVVSEVPVTHVSNGTRPLLLTRLAP